MKSLTLLLMVFYASSIFAQTSTLCAEPVGANAEAFNLISNKSNSEFEALLKNNKDLKSARNKFCERLYHVAIRARNEEARKILDRMGYGPRNSKSVNENYREMSTYSSTSYFTWALKYGLPETYDDLKKRGGVSTQFGAATDINFVVYDCNDSGLISHLVKKGFDVNHDDQLGLLDSTPIISATQNCSFKVIDELMRNGADADVRTGKTSPLFNIFERYKAKEVDISYFKVLLINGTPNLNLKIGGETLLVNAIMMGDFELVRLLVELGADVNLMTSSYSPMMILLSSDKKTGDSLVVLLEYLISSGADVNPPGSSTQPIHLAGYFDTRIIAELLLKNGANVHVKNTDGSTILHTGVPCNWSKEDIEWLVTLFPSGSITHNASGNRPSDKALRCNRGREIVEILKKIEI